MPVKDGGAAFPLGLKGKVVFGGGRYDGAHVPEYQPIHEGMSLRDWFAGQALAGLAAYPGREGERNEPHHFARWAYALADAMILARGGGDV
ncbi:hypothetical protein BA190_09200 [Labrys sp. WJW]|uniref:hypothetical protein n=1 Tax=Labrys sp. WJW TaxID=1737983 RepID=UPI00082BF160|nr:hypothetical protein [Labrys sp. WJW]OCC05081.1 hypothetical protein BA190_09200 [Labrys sp. WJW]